MHKLNRSDLWNTDVVLRWKEVPSDLIKIKFEQMKRDLLEEQKYLTNEEKSDKTRIQELSQQEHE